MLRPFVLRRLKHKVLEMKSCNYLLYVTAYAVFIAFWNLITWLLTTYGFVMFMKCDIRMSSFSDDAETDALLFAAINFYTLNDWLNGLYVCTYAYVVLTIEFSIESFMSVECFFFKSSCLPCMYLYYDYNIWTCACWFLKRWFFSLIYLKPAMNAILNFSV